MSRVLKTLAIIAGLGVILPLLAGCSDSEAQADTSPPAPDKAVAAPARPAKAAPARSAKAEQPAKSFAKEPPRKHPFAAVFSRNARSAARISSSMGPLKLKAVLGGAVRSAIIQEGEETHLVKEGELLGNLLVLAIRDDEVVLEAGDRKQILSLYDH